MYRNEKACGRAIKNSGLDRSSVFFTTKIPPGSMGYERTKRAIESSLREAEQEYFDLCVSSPLLPSISAINQLPNQNPNPRPLRRQKGPSRLVGRSRRGATIRKSTVNRGIKLRRAPSR